MNGFGRVVAAAGLCAALARGAQAQSAAYTTPHFANDPGAVSVEVGGETFVNQGLVGVGRLSARTLDFAGETLGSFSGMAADPSVWRRHADGSYTGRIFTLPDRGPNDVGSIKGTTDYRNRVHAHDVVLIPSVGGPARPAVEASQSQLKIKPAGGFLLRDALGAPFTGKDPGANVVTRGGIVYPSPASGEGAGHISLDSEAITRLADGSFYIGEEYAPGLYYFDRKGRQIGAIQTVPALMPKIDGVVNFTADKAPATGRRNNQGLEAASVTPDGRRLVSILQSAAMQDTSGAKAQTRNNTRILVYDITHTKTPTAPIGHYVLQLPVYTNKGDGGAPDRTAAQSEMIALNDHQFLVLARDSIGRGSGASASNSPVYKSVLLVDVAGATNLVGTPYEQGTTPVAVDGTLVAGIAPATQPELVNLLNPVQLARFGMNLKTAPSDKFSLSEKWEAMTLLPALDPKAPHDFFLMIGNDNDFIAGEGHINGVSFDGALDSATGGSGDNDNMILVYRLTLPTYHPARSRRAALAK